MIRNAIKNMDIIEFTYQGYPRIAEPHVYGVKNEKRKILVYQIGGSASSGRIPDWRRMDIGDISNFRTNGQKFTEARTLPLGDYSEWDMIIAMVKQQG